jgi:Mlc titration factor MtfA (ptsG expression regulator)
MNITRWLRRAVEARRLRKSRIPEALWRDTLAQRKLLQSLNPAERHRLRELASRFLQVKTFSGANEFMVSDEIRTLIAAQACLLILELDLSYFDGWYEIIVYPDTFVVQRDRVDASGVVQQSHDVLGGESWQRGPVILSWADAQSGETGANVILHEFAHKLDMLNGAANGMPPLHKTMRRETWTQVFQQAYDDLSHQITSHHHSVINPYALTNPAEFFAVTTELFFENPQQLVHSYPALYDQLRQFYRQDPWQREHK